MPAPSRLADAPNPVKTKCWAAQVQINTNGRVLVGQQLWSSDDFTYWALDPFRSRETDPQLAKTECLFRRPSLLGNLYSSRPGDLIDQSTIVDCRALFLDLDHPTSECFRFLDPFERWSYFTARSTPRNPRLRVILPVAAPLTVTQATAAYHTMNAMSGGDAGVNQIAYPPIQLLGKAAPTVRFHPGRLIAWSDLAPLVVDVPEPEPSDRDRPRIIKSRSVRRLYQLYRSGDNFQRSLQTLLGDRLIGRSSVRCPLPGHAHDDKNPSANVLFADGQLPVLCCHMGHGHGKMVMDLGELELHKPRGGWLGLQGETLPTRSLNAPTQMLGHARLMFRSGVASIDEWTQYPDLGELHEAIVHRANRTERGWSKDGIIVSTTTLERALNFLREFSACKRMIGHTTYTTLTVEFIQGWMDVSYETAWNVKQFLSKVGVIVPGASVAHGRGYQFGVGRDSAAVHSQRIKGLSSIRLWTLVHPSEVGSFTFYLDDS